MGTLSDDLLRIARRAADKLTMTKRGSLPALEDIEDACEDDVAEMLDLLQDEDAFGEVDLSAQQKVLDQIEAALPENRRELVDELISQHAQHVSVQQEAAYHLGLAVGMKFAGRVAEASHRGADEDEEDDEFVAAEDDDREEDEE